MLNFDELALELELSKIHLSDNENDLRRRFDGAIQALMARFVKNEISQEYFSLAGSAMVLMRASVEKEIDCLDAHL